VYAPEVIITGASAAVFTLHPRTVHPEYDLTVGKVTLPDVSLLNTVTDTVRTAAPLSFNVAVNVVR